MKEQGSVCEQKIFNTFYDKHAEVIYRYVYYKCGDKQQAEDLVQEAFIKLWMNCKKVLLSKAKSFLYTVSRNLFLNQITHKKVVLEHRKLFVKSSTDENPEYLMEEQEFLKKLEGAIGDLSEKQRVVFLLNRIDKKTYKEIAELLGLSVKTVEKRMSLALKALRVQIKGI